ncbi:hypothetical protein PQ460_06830 [Paenibacillus sp. KACC 21273]|uniref:hypothetical protein n=1 Tax=Paenibacillus sp. KACC 21273 TaxID=3025665 RepID=UPI002365C2D3|nr:hypothetical protein [Paenibacillus sp. KACC 21273]WDF52121.1 hypothetical protein PQ460_06830 [Paenibacillus sp. KACC 21273]
MSNWIAGELEVNQERAIYPALTLAQVLQSQWYNDYFTEIRDMNNGYVWYSFQDVPISSHVFSVSLLFQNSVFRMTMMSISDPKYGQSWDDWTEAKELQRKQEHDALLRQELERKPDVRRSKPYPYIEYKVAYGSISSSYDPRSASSSISITYT